MWTGEDTVCRKWSTGGLQQANFSVVDDDEERDICSMCASVYAIDAEARYAEMGLNVEPREVVFVARARERLDRELELEAAAKRSGKAYALSDDDSVPF